MERPAENVPPDPNRIPTSVFARTKSSTPMEWSAASNESLFSIHVVSFKGHAADAPAFSMDGSFPRQSGESFAFPMTTTEAANAAAMKEVMCINAEEKARKEGADRSLSHRSDESFAFPVLTGEKTGVGSKKVEAAGDAESGEPQPETQKATEQKARNEKTLTAITE
ncbi:uncharacterized protein LOC122048751 [Zingiber officinale]|uniref:uncharacterized protein LOC122048751 n=1 Tax=Zingiber officinale TaxID=94328 RepID=UPI001C4DCA51|nr:uncharacterized protein LOC122048751 [Zingiber officinale]